MAVLAVLTSRNGDQACSTQTNNARRQVLPEGKERIMNRHRHVGVVWAVLLGISMAGPGWAESPATSSRPGLPGGAHKVTVQPVLQPVLANQRYETDLSTTLEILFVDGTTLTLGPGTTVIVEIYEYQQEQRRGRVVMRVERGLFRVVGGLLNSTSTLLIQTPGAQLALDSASAIVAVDHTGGTRANLLLGRSLTMSSGGQAKTLERSGFQLVSRHANEPPTGPTRMDKAAMQADLFALNPQLAPAGPGAVGEQRQLVATVTALATEERPLGALSNQPGPGNGGPGSSVPPDRPGSLTDVLGGATGFGGRALEIVRTEGTQPSQANGDTLLLTQTRDAANNARAKRKTANWLFNSADPFTQVISGKPNEQPRMVDDNADSGNPDPLRDSNLQYVFAKDDDSNTGISLILDRVDATQDVKIGEGPLEVRAPFILHFERPENGHISMPQDLVSNVENPFNGTGRGSSLFKKMRYTVLQAGFSLRNGQVRREPDHFLLIDVRSLDSPSQEHFLFATGDLDSRTEPLFTRQFSIDRFFLSAGLENFDQKDQGKTIADNLRGFLRTATSLGIPLVDTGLLVVNAGPSSPAGAQDALLHADFGLTGTGNAQKSTISVTIGNVDYRLQPFAEAIVQGQTLGSSRRTGQEAAVAFSSPLGNSAAGGGNPALKNPDGTLRQGYAGYFVLENFDPDPASSLRGGIERPLGASATTQQYAYLRLATATGSLTPGSRSTLSWQGWAAGLAEFQSGNGIGVSQMDTDNTPGNFLIETNAATNRVKARLAFFGHPLLQLGDLSDDTRGASAFVDDNLFAARTVAGGDAEVAMITGDVLKGALPQEMRDLIPTYDHIKWGFFFGDMLTTSGQRQHVHLGSWVAGRIPKAQDLPSIGTATYAGHAIGNVLNNGSLYTAVGSLQNTWDFGKRAGTMQMQFDNTTYNGETRLLDSSATFQGKLDATHRVGGVHGTFVQGGADPAAGVLGRFSIQEKQTPGASTYRASGTFAAEKK